MNIIRIIFSQLAKSTTYKTGQPLVKNETGTLPNTIHKNKLKMD